MIDLNSKKYIFKFYPVSINLVKTLLYQELWFSSLKNFNDPFEAEFIIKNTGGSLEEYAHWFYSVYMDYQGEPFKYEMMMFENNKEHLFEDLKDAYKDFLDKNYGISCFSRKFNNVLMWSHYADSHRGVCLVFNKEGVYADTKSKGIEIFEPDEIYTDKLIEVETSFSPNKAKFENPEIVLHKKSKLWMYEEEVRFILELSKNNKDRFVPFDKTHLKAIILGGQIGNEDGYLVYKLGKQMNNNLPILTAQKDLITNKIRVGEEKVKLVIGHNLYT